MPPPLQINSCWEKNSATKSRLIFGLFLAGRLKAQSTTAATPTRATKSATTTSAT